MILKSMYAGRYLPSCSLGNTFGIISKRKLLLGWILVQFFLVKVRQEIEQNFRKLIIHIPFMKPEDTRPVTEMQITTTELEH